ncbi:MAG: hypothetical protein WCF90_02670 [Methanomicrobiales archaeon]
MLVLRISSSLRYNTREQCEPEQETSGTYPLFATENGTEFVRGATGAKVFTVNLTQPPEGDSDSGSTAAIAGTAPSIATSPRCSSREDNVV